MSKENGGGASNHMATINASVDKKLSEDADFQASIADLSDDEKTEKTAEKRSQLLEAEINSLGESATKNKELADNYKTRAEKAEKAKKGEGEETETHNAREENSLTPMDAVVLARANIHQDDIQEIIDYAKFKKISITEALASTVIQTSLKTRADERKTAEATTTGGARPGNSTPSGEKLLEKAESSGELPSTDAGIDAMAQARLDRRMKKGRK